ncbi:hypothetical protein EJB05_53303, partial [Eragrostis curvula]
MARPQKPSLSTVLTGANKVAINHVNPSVLTGANAIPVNNVASTTHPKVANAADCRAVDDRTSVFDRIQFPKVSVFSRLNAEDLERNAMEAASANQEGTQNNKSGDAMGLQKQKEIMRMEGETANKAGSSRELAVNSNFKQVKTVPSVTGPKLKIQHYCERCLLLGHSRKFCRNPIRCSNCRDWGHIASNCPNPPINPGFQPKESPVDSFTRINAGPWKALNPQNWFKQRPAQPMGPSSSRPPVLETPVNFILVGQSPGSRTNEVSNPSTSPTTVLQLANKSPSFHPIEQNSPSTAIASQPNRTDEGCDAMAYQRADPSPWMPRNSDLIEVENRKVMVRAVTRRPPPRHEDFGVVTITPLPGNQILFHNIHEVVHEFLTVFKRVRIRDIQPTHLGQALVRFEYVHDRDNLINAGVHHYGGCDFEIHRHNEARNWRGLDFNRECWLLLLGFPLDYRSAEFIQSALCTFAKVESWEDELGQVARLLVKAKVTELQDVPPFLVLTDVEGYRGNSWTAQCEIINQRLLGVLAADEEPVPQLVNGAPIEFAFFGYGQPGQASPQNNHDEAEEGEQEDQADWGEWLQNGPPDAAPAAQEQVVLEEADNIQAEEAPEEQHVEEQLFDLNEAPEEVDMEIVAEEGVQHEGNLFDLNVPMEEDLVVLQNQQLDVINQGLPEHEHGDAGEAFIELNDFVNDLINEDVQPEDDSQLSFQVSDSIMGGNGSVGYAVSVNQPAPLGHNAEVVLALEAVDNAPVAAFLPMELQIEDLIGDQIQQHNHGQDNNGNANMNLQVGMMQFASELRPDPVFQSMFDSLSFARQKQPSPDCYRLWAKFFFPIGMTEPRITIPAAWASFIITMLLAPETFESAKSLLISKAWDIIRKHASKDEEMAFILPAKCPVTEKMHCPSEEAAPSKATLTEPEEKEPPPLTENEDT